MQKFLIIQTAFIGDVVLATVLIEKLHANFPDAQIDFLLRKGNESLLLNHPYLNEVLIWVKKKSKTKNLFKLIGIIRKNQYDKVINVQRFFSTGLMTALSNAKEKIGFDKNPLSFLFDIKVKHIIGTKENPLHEVERNLSLIKHFTNDTMAGVKLYPSQEDFEMANAIINNQKARKSVTPQEETRNTINRQLLTVNYICVAPSSVWFTKQYPKEKWIEFLKEISVSVNIFFLGAGSDKNLCDEIISALPDHSTKNKCGELTFLQSAALMKNALMNYANDSAPLHIASAMNAPITAVFCSTVTRFGYWPLSDKSFIVEKTEPLYCRPCSVHGKKFCPEGHFKCALDISKHQLLETFNYE
ncbi:MAG: glycosyltransferase family 9 protein [Parafilimonas sp.]|nr:glycosyltransferase family 9 protein [Parafilimonas sp.]